MIPTYSLPVYRYADTRTRFQITGLDLTGNTAKAQFRDPVTNTLLLELSTANAKIEIEVTDTNNGFITFVISSADSLLLNANAQWDLFVTDAMSKRKALVRGGTCYSDSVTEF